MEKAQETKKTSGLNLPNRLTVLRMLLIPIFMFFIVYSGELWARLTAAAVFSLTAFTDMLDGKIARKYNLITDLGKFLDPLADKLMVLGALLALMYQNREDGFFSIILMCVTFIVIFREIAVTSMRMIASSKEGIVIPANMAGKVKTVTQIFAIICVILEPLLGYTPYYASLALLAVMTAATLYSGAVYFGAYLPVIIKNINR